jgi:hypothetical protein
VEDFTNIVLGIFLPNAENSPPKKKVDTIWLEP